MSISPIKRIIASNKFLETGHSFLMIGLIALFITGLVIGISEIKELSRTLEFLLIVEGLNIMTALFIYFLHVIVGLNVKKLLQKEEEERILESNIKYRREVEEKERLRLHKDLILEQIKDDFNKTTQYTLKLQYGDGECEYLCFKGNTYAYADYIRPVTQFTFESEYAAKNYGSYIYKFPAEALPTLKNVIEHYQKYEHLLAPPPKRIEVERFVISRPIPEDPPDLTGIDTVHELAPLLIQAELDGDHKGVHKILNKMETLQQALE